jgi:antitoxin VapB
MIATAKIFQNGASQAVRLPKEFRFDSAEVCIKRIGSAVLLFPRDTAWNLMADAIARMDEDVMSQRHQPRRAAPRKPLDAKKPKRP